MDWTDSATGTAIVGRPHGRIDEASWEAFLAGITSRILVASEAGKGFVLDLADVDYMSSRGLRVLTLAKREADGHGLTLTLARPNERMREILAISRYDRIFTVADDLPAGAA
ncbi:STAS domain-containing protein [Sphingomonas solaris]|uniref:STAS domain-containing protein n=1 Tax=Alterirhizorhabdus solaris TaxID=2529389 RepID=A0A558QXI6_9SPHN|nr:STAS domain-containing protein [Sphingomonas solaris]TVV71876.1 STAS domain-containing protein [Sphingomonas solaris]